MSILESEHATKSLYTNYFIGDVVVFLDAHCEVGPNWLPPLLAPIYDNPKTLSVPVIDGINWNDFSINPVYGSGTHSRGDIFYFLIFYLKNVHLRCSARTHNGLQVDPRIQKYSSGYLGKTFFEHSYSPFHHKLYC